MAEVLLYMMKVTQSLVALQRIKVGRALNFICLLAKVWIAIDRAHRIGQRHPVNVYKIVSSLYHVYLSL
jgi:hypothetical protein